MVFLIQVEVDTSGVVKGQKAVQRGLQQTENAANKLRATLARTFAILGGVALISRSVRALASFEQSMSTVRAVTGATAEQMKVFTRTAQELGITTRFSATQAADALVILSRAGFAVEESLEAVDDVLNLAVAGGLDLASAADITASALRGFRLEADQAGRVADVLAKGANIANTDVRALGEGLKFVAPIAAGLGVSLEETTAALSTLSDAGLKGSLAGTGLRRVFSELESASKATEKIFAKLGVSTQEVRISQVGLTKALLRLKDAGIDTGQALEVFGDRGGPAFEVLANAIPKVAEFNKTLNEAEGTVRMVAQIMDDNLNGALIRVNSAFDGVIQAFGQAGGSSQLTTFLEGLAKVFRTVAENVDVLVTAIDILVDILIVKLARTAAVAAIAALTRLGTSASGAAVQMGAAATATQGFSAKLLALNFAKSAGALAGFVVILEGTVSLFKDITQAIEEAETAAESFFNQLAVISPIGLPSLAKLREEIQGRPVQVTPISRPTTAIPPPPSIPKELQAPDAQPFQFLADAINNATAATREFILETTRQVAVNTQLLNPLRDEQEVLKLLAEGHREEARARQLVLDLQNEGINATTAEVNAALALEDANEKLRRQIELLNEIRGPAEQYAETLENLNVLLAMGAIGQDEFAVAADRAKLAALSAATSIEAGFERAFAKIRLEAQDMASVVEGIFDTMVDASVNVLEDLVRTGGQNFKELADQALQQIQRIILRQLVLLAISALLPGAGPLAGAASGLTSGLNFGGGGSRQRGGTVQPGRAFTVGEAGPETFVPGRTGTIVPNQAAAQAEAPIVNIMIVNESDPDMVKKVIQSGAADDVFINRLGANKSKTRNALAL